MKAIKTLNLMNLFLSIFCILFFSFQMVESDITREIFSGFDVSFGITNGEPNYFVTISFVLFICLFILTLVYAFLIFFKKCLYKNLFAVILMTLSLFAGISIYLIPVYRADMNDLSNSYSVY